MCTLVVEIGNQPKETMETVCIRMFYMASEGLNVAFQLCVLEGVFFGTTFQ